MSSVAEMLRAVDLYVGYGESDIVKGVSVSVASGEVVAIVGPNGAGKSTFIKGLAGLLGLHSGEVWLNGKRVDSSSAVRRATAGLGYVPQSDFVFPRLTVIENLLIGGFRLHRSMRRSRVMELVSEFPRLEPLLHRRAGSLSGGEQRLVGLTRALMSRPSVLLLDEPTAALEPRATVTVWEAIAQLRAAGLALLIVEQRTDAVLRAADRGLVLVNGNTVLEERADALLTEYNLGEIFLGADPRAALAR